MDKVRAAIPRHFRNPVCVHYYECLDIAAHLNVRDLGCRGCQRFEPAPGICELNAVLPDLAGYMKLIAVVFWPKQCRRLGIYGNDREDDELEQNT